MATLKLVLSKRVKANGKYPLIYRITHKRKSIDHYLNIDINAKDWSSKLNFINKKSPIYDQLKRAINNKEERLLEAIYKLEIHNPNYTITDIKRAVASYATQHTFNSFAELQIKNMHKSKRHGNAISYSCALSSISSVYGNYIKFEQIDYKLLEDLEVKLRVKGLKTNAIGAYMRAIRTIYNKAIKEDLVDIKHYPFRKYRIKSETTISRALTIEEIRQIHQLQLEENTLKWHARNYFFIIFCLIGINFADLATLKKNNIKRGRVNFRRKKTKKLYDIKLTTYATKLLSIYSREAEFLLPFIKEFQPSSSRIKALCKEKLRQVNKQLKYIGEELGFDIPLTTYVARHSWATIAKKMGAPNEAIAEALGHEYGNKVTNIYLDSFDKEVVDELNQKIQDRIFM